MSVSRELKWLIIVVGGATLVFLLVFLAFGIGSESGVDVGDPLKTSTTERK